MMRIAAHWLHDAPTPRGMPRPELLAPELLAHVVRLRDHAHRYCAAESGRTRRCESQTLLVGGGRGAALQAF